MAQPTIVDLRNVYRADEMQRGNFRYVGIGVPGMAAMSEKSAIGER
jgi:hypothetical protein